MARTEKVELTVLSPKFCGVKQFPIEDGRYIVFLFSADRFRGEIISSKEGNMHWVKKEDLANVNLVDDFTELIQVIQDDKLTEFQYIIEDGKWKVVLK